MAKVTLRFVRIEDADAIFKIIDSYRSNLRQWLTFIDDTSSVLFTKDYIKTTNQYKRGGDIVCVIEYNNVIVGLIGYESINIYRNKAELGYWLSPEYENRGIMTTAVFNMLKMGFNEFNFNRIEIKCALDNIRSYSIAEKFLFNLEGIERDGEKLSNGEYTDVRVYSMLKRDYEMLYNKGNINILGM